MFQDFCPRLSPENHQITSPQTPLYNCLAWAANADIWFIWPDQEETCAWPDCLPRCETVECIEAFFGLLGFAKCDSPDLAPNLEKIAIYAKDGSPEHVARQLDNGHWTSKLGDLVDIEHVSFLDVSDGDYGAVVSLMARDKNLEPKPLPAMSPMGLIITT